MGWVKYMQREYYVWSQVHKYSIFKSHYDYSIVHGIRVHGILLHRTSTYRESNQYTTALRIPKTRQIQPNPSSPYHHDLLSSPLQPPWPSATKYMTGTYPYYILTGTNVHGYYDIVTSGDTRFLRGVRFLCGGFISWKWSTQSQGIVIKDINWGWKLLIMTDISGGPRVLHFLPKEAKHKLLTNIIREIKCGGLKYYRDK